MPQVDLVSVPRRRAAPLRAIAERVGLAVALVLFIAVVVRLGRDGYADAAGGTISFLDSLYYASVTVTTTGYGDIAAVTPGTRLAALLLITPARIVFLILVVGTTVEVLTEQSRRLLRTQRWRRDVDDHVIVCGFGSTGRSAARALRRQGVPIDDIVVVDTNGRVIEEANQEGLVGVRGDASLRGVLDQAGIATARSVVVTPNRDDTAVLITLTARELNPGVDIVVAGREDENLHLLRQSGADSVIHSADAVGRMLGFATSASSVVAVLDDLLSSGDGLDIEEVAPTVTEDGTVLAPEGCAVVAVVRDGRSLLPRDPGLGPLRADDRLVVVRGGLPARPR